MNMDRSWLDGLASNPTGAGASARSLLDLGRLDEACLAIDTQIASMRSPTADVLMLRAQILLAMASHQAAATAFKRVILAAPSAAAPEFGLALALAESGDSSAAVSAAQRALAKGMDTPGVRYLLARALFDAGRIDESEALFRGLLTHAPMHVDAHRSLADIIWMRTGGIKAATAMLDAALRDAPDFVPLRIVKARLLEAAGFAELGYEELAVGLCSEREHAEMHALAAQASVQWDPALALSHAEQAVRIAPGHPGGLATYAHMLLAAGFADRALTIANQLLAGAPHDSRALALKGTALRMLGDATYHDLYDYTRHVRAGTIDVPNGWSTLADYLRDLAAALNARHDQLQAHPVAQSLRHGTQTQLRLDNAAEAAIRAFPAAINGPIRRYIEAIGRDDVLLRRGNGRAFRVRDAWSVRLRGGGYHFSHFHGKGWLSSACYIDVPESMNASSDQGWLQFGEPMMKTNPPMPPEYLVKPEPGLLVLFPSWMWHGTIPFVAHGRQRRLSVAFDVIPGGT